MTSANERYEAARQIIEEGPCTSITTVATQVLCDYFRITPKTLRVWVLDCRFPRAVRIAVMSGDSLTSENTCKRSLVHNFKPPRDPSLGGIFYLKKTGFNPRKAVRPKLFHQCDTFI